MSEPRMNLFERYRPFRRWVEAGLWILILAVQAAFATVVAVIDTREAGHGAATWQPVTWEISSHLALLALVPVLIVFERRFPLNRSTWRRNWAWHVLGSVIFSLAHVGLMVGMRQIVYAWAGTRYDFGDWLAKWPYEYLKDARTYALFLLAIMSYRLFMLRLQGEARVLDPPEGVAEPALPGAAETADNPPESPPRPDRFLVRKLRREFLISASDIDWLQAQGNYVGLRVNGHDYLLRATLTDFLTQLDPARYARVHRSYAANLDRIAEIEPLDGGDARLHMRDGTHIPCSRRYRTALRS
ncbi:LytTR family DNA-binding domain-containing protein [Variovorax sp. J22R24]|uniref:LytTR family DNA-binding domain-containing protein n=1 Tax=Variovorax gracilis TaxID=3053502 RepID=UPI002577A8D2|nr:LytTR family DNA-binding domain-containing protein [Variovorax sp. J22R24]MDM0104129.1 LytTR family DNA-binding domain-containing protein [Variovorax sp. J22R24]